MRRIYPELPPLLIDSISHLMRQDPEDEEDEDDEEGDIRDNYEEGGNDDGYSE